ncbi:Golgi membrane exchange factor (Ric1p-Rgp1p) subunit, partial [Homalodisca vitripennis]
EKCRGKTRKYNKATHQLNRRRDSAITLSTRPLDFDLCLRMGRDIRGKMIEISAKLIGGPVYLPGENVGCYITFMNPPLPNDIRSRSHRDDLEVLAWATAQIHCQCSTNGKVPLPSKTPYLPEEKVVSNSAQIVNVINSHFILETSFAPCQGDKGRIVLSTTPKILFCDLRLSPGESKSFFYSQSLPLEALPSYRGQLVKYSYKITIGSQRVNGIVKLLRVPLRVLDISGKSSFHA